MSTEISKHATPVESIGEADDALNVTTVEDVTESVATDFSEEEAAFDAEQAGLAIGEGTDEEEAAEEVDKNDLNGKSKHELVEMFAELLAAEPVQTLRKSAEAIKIAFYKQHRAEIDAARKAFEAKQMADKELQERKAKENEMLLKSQKAEEEALLKAKADREKQLEQDRKAKQKQVAADRKAKMKAREELRKQKEREYKERLKAKEKARKQKEREYKAKLKAKEKARKEALKAKEAAAKAKRKR